MHAGGDAVNRYAPWQRDVSLAVADRRRLAAELLNRAGAFPREGDAVLEVGCGSLGWLGEFMTWGVCETDLHGIERDQERASLAMRRFPAADLRIGDAASMPWTDSTFRLVVVSTVFSSILDSMTRRRMASEIVRVLAPSGALLWYDFAYDNPRNREVKGISRGEVRSLFSTLQGPIHRVTLAPPLARVVAPLSWTLASLLQGIPLLCTHLLAVLLKGPDEGHRHMEPAHRQVV